MLDDIAGRKERLDEPVVLEWVLDRVVEERELELDPERAPATALCDADTVARCLERHDDPSRLFAGGGPAPPGGQPGGAPQPDQAGGAPARAAARRGQDIIRHVSK